MTNINSYLLCRGRNALVCCGLIALLAMTLSSGLAQSARLGSHANISRWKTSRPSADSKPELIDAARRSRIGWQRYNGLQRVLWTIPGMKHSPNVSDLDCGRDEPLAYDRASQEWVCKESDWQMIKNLTQRVERLENEVIRLQEELNKDRGRGKDGATTRRDNLLPRE